MGCAASRLDNEDTVRRCKERRRLMKAAVHSRHHLASAHSDYLRSLLLTGSSLSRFAAGEPLSVSQQTPHVLLHHHHHHSAASSPHPSSIPPPPSSRHAPTPSITNSKLPHILSDSSIRSASKRFSSQPSSVWEWENFYPPSPPSSDFFNHLKEEEEEEKEQSFEEINYHEADTVHDFPRGHYSGSGSSSECDEEEERCSRSARSDAGGSSSVDVGARPAPLEKPLRRERSDFGSYSAGWNGRDECSSSSAATGDLRMVVRHRNLAEIVASLEEYFVKASAAGEHLSDLLEIGRAQLDRSFRHLKSKDAV